MPTSLITGDGKFIPLEEARDLYDRVCRAAQGFRLDTLLAEMGKDGVATFRRFHNLN